MSEENAAELEPQNENENTEEELETPVSQEGETPKTKKGTKSDVPNINSIDIEALKKELMGQIRKEEKDKVYNTLEKYKEEAKKIEEQKKELEAKLQEYETSKLTVEEQAALKLSKLEESNMHLQSQLESIMEEANNKINALQVELAKKDILSQYGDEIIPSLVSGNTIEELQESAEKAHREYQSIVDREREKLEATFKKAKTGVGSGVSPTNDRLNAGVNVADIKRIDDPKVWEANRNKLLEEALKNR
jgi:hypothetical protein